MVISRVIIRVTPFRALTTLLITYLLKVPCPIKYAGKLQPGDRLVQPMDGLRDTSALRCGSTFIVFTHETLLFVGPL